MNRDLTVSVSGHIAATKAQVWDALVNPDKIAQYLFGTKTESTWEIGSPITFTGSYDGQEYMDKGEIVNFEPEAKLEYTYLSSFSGLEDEDENYSLVAFHISGTDGDVTLTIHQLGFASEEAQQHSSQAWSAVLDGIKQIAEA